MGVGVVAPSSTTAKRRPDFKGNALRRNLHVLTHNRLGVMLPRRGVDNTSSDSETPGVRRDMKLNTWGSFTSDSVEG